MFKPLLAYGLVLISALPGLSTAQSPAPAVTPAPTTASPPPAFRSAMDGYKPYTEEATANWKEANDTTARIGGWRVYAKEARQAQAPEAAPPGDARNAPAKP
ncbi:hypothetical protein [Polaromonas sp. JS666]|uniref:hypothetical protein n=1 Tax=Polaromonas sp. (strain JS666 / ATCC BAA-500) TaxID=296591 RepID=UPI000891863C|nr:hypothetical protein [Polaromonas sp. JS666]SDN94515.1 hypothetical protein SAMN05720382_11082 [Polaromonas sp. JS666]